MIPTKYQQLWADPELQSRIDEGIERHRKSDATIKITNGQGRPLEGVKIHVAQRDSSFQFGANIFKLGGYDSAELNRKYEEAYCRLFNSATIPFYWRTLEPEQGKPRYSAQSAPIARRPPPDVVIDFCRQNELRMHGHTLVWELIKWSIPPWLPEDPAVSEPLWENRVREIAERYGHIIKQWDVLNEATAGYKYPDAHPMPKDYERKAFAWAEKYFPHDVRLDINEVTAAWKWHLDKYCQLIECLLQDKARIGAIGLQFHLFSDAELGQVFEGELFPPGELLQALDRIAAFQLPVHVSEITLTSPGNTPQGQRLQAEAARNFYRLWFSHPAVGGISWWNLPDGGAAPGEDTVFSGLVHEDMSPKPAYLALENLLHQEWRTEAAGLTNSEGCFRFRGFHGNYSAKTETGFESSLVLKPGEPATLVLQQTVESAD